MLNTTTQSKQSQQYISHYPVDSVKNQPKRYRLSVCKSVNRLSVAENRFAQIPEKMPYRYKPMTQITSSLIGGLPIVENL